MQAERHIEAGLILCFAAAFLLGCGSDGDAGDASASWASDEAEAACRDVYAASFGRRRELGLAGSSDGARRLVKEVGKAREGRDAREAVIRVIAESNDAEARMGGLTVLIVAEAEGPEAVDAVLDAAFPVLSNDPSADVRSVAALAIGARITTVDSATPKTLEGIRGTRVTTIDSKAQRAIAEEIRGGLGRGDPDRRIGFGELALFCLHGHLLQVAAEEVSGVVSADDRLWELVTFLDRCDDSVARPAVLSIVRGGHGRARLAAAGIAARGGWIEDDVVWGVVEADVASSPVLACLALRYTGHPTEGTIDAIVSAVRTMPAGPLRAKFIRNLGEPAVGLSEELVRQLASKLLEKPLGGADADHLVVGLRGALKRAGGE